MAAGNKSREKVGETVKYVFEAIKTIRKAKNRPDNEAIIMHVCTKHGLKPADVGSQIAELEKLQKLVCKTYEDGRQSYFIVEDDQLSDANVEDVELSGANSSNPCTPNESFESQSSTGLVNTLASPADSIKGVPDVQGTPGLISAFTTMANTVNILNNLIQVERGKSEKLLTENFALKKRVLELETLVENFLGPQTLANNETTTETSLLSEAQRNLQLRKELINESNQYKETVSNHTSDRQHCVDVDTYVGNTIGNKRQNQNNRQTLQTSRGTRKANNKRKPERKQHENANVVDLTTANKVVEEENQESNKRIKVTIIGDSQLLRLDEKKLSNKHREVKIQAKSGMRLNQILKNTGKMDSDVVIIHVGTNDLKNSKPEELSTGILTALKKIQENNPDAKIAYSSIFRRKDELNKLAMSVNKQIAEKLMLNGFDLIENENILYSNLAQDGLHINTGGARKFASNLSRFIKYC